MKRITTVRGDIAPEKAGITSMHDHTFVDLSIAGQFMKNLFGNIPESMLGFVPENYDFLKTGVYLMSSELQKVDDIDFLEKEYGYFRQLGGETVVDPGPISVRGSAEQLKLFAERTGLNLVCATGVYTATSRPAELLGKGEQELYSVMKREVEKGIDDTDVHPGIIKTAVATYGPDGKILQPEIDGIFAGARLAAETGMALYIHTDPQIREEDLLQIVDSILERYSVNPEKIQMCHLDNRLSFSVNVKEYMTNQAVARNINLETQKKLLDKGINIGLDTWGMSLESAFTFTTDDYDRMKALVLLAELGYDSQLTLGNDFSSKLYGKSYGGFGCTRFLSYGIRLLKEMGKEDLIKKVLVENPARILAY